MFIRFSHRKGKKLIQDHAAPNSFGIDFSALLYINVTVVGRWRSSGTG